MSEALLELENLDGLAKHHWQLCNGPDCRVSLTLLRKTALRLLPMVWPSEHGRAKDILDNWQF